jgi:Fic family protein
VNNTHKLHINSGDYTHIWRASEWLAWFLVTLFQAVTEAHTTLDQVFSKANFWQRWASTPMTAQKINLLNRLLDGFEGKLTTRKWAAIAKCSPDTALRDLVDLVSRGILHKTDAGGRSTSYALAHARHPMAAIQTLSR